MKKPIDVTGKWFITLFGPDGSIKDHKEGKNVICSAGKSYLVDYLSTAVGAATTFTMKYIAIGTDATGEDAANTALGTESARHTGTVSTAAGPIYRVTATFASGVGTASIVEYGLFSSSSAGTMFSRDTEGVVTKGANDELRVITEITFS
jgi:hypothetical protein